MIRNSIQLSGSYAPSTKKKSYFILNFFDKKFYKYIAVVFSRKANIFYELCKKEKFIL
jgi:hypothetical protein